MDLKKFTSLIDLFLYQAGKQNPQSAFLEWLNPKNKKNVLLLNAVCKMEHLPYL